MTVQSAVRIASATTGAAAATAVCVFWLQSAPSHHVHETVVFETPPPTCEPASELAPQPAPTPAPEPSTKPPPTPEPPTPPPSARSRFGPGSCPPPRAGRDVSAGQSLEEVESLEGWHEDYGLMLGVATSQTMPDVIVGWTARDIYASSDGGRRFRRVLDGPGAVTSVAVDCHGRVIALRDRHRLGIRHGQDELWRSLEFARLAPSEDDDALAIAAGGGWIGWVGRSDREFVGMLALSADDGVSWRYHALGTWSEPRADLRISPKGSVTLLTTWFDCMSGGQDLWLGAARGDLETGSVPKVETGTWVGHDGWLYNTEMPCQHDGDGAWVCAAKRGREWTSVGVPGEIDHTTLTAATNGRCSLGVIGKHVVRLRGGKLTVLADDVPEGFVAHSVDSRGRLLGLASGHLLRWSPRRGWRVLWGPALE